MPPGEQHPALWSRPLSVRNPPSPPLVLIAGHLPTFVVSAYGHEERPEPDALCHPGIRQVERQIDTDLEVQTSAIAAGSRLEKQPAASYSSHDPVVRVRENASVVKQQLGRFDHPPSVSPARRVAERTLPPPGLGSYGEARCCDGAQVMHVIFGRRPVRNVVGAANRQRLTAPRALSRAPPARSQPSQPSPNRASYERLSRANSPGPAPGVAVGRAASAPVCPLGAFPAGQVGHPTAPAVKG